MWFLSIHYTAQNKVAVQWSPYFHIWSGFTYRIPFPQGPRQEFCGWSNKEAKLNSA